MKTDHDHTDFVELPQFYNMPSHQGTVAEEEALGHLSEGTIAPKSEVVTIHKEKPENEQVTLNAQKSGVSLQCDNILYEVLGSVSICRLM